MTVLTSASVVAAALILTLALGLGAAVAIEALPAAAPERRALNRLTVASAGVLFLLVGVRFLVVAG